MSVKQRLMKVMRPIILPITRIILKKHYKQSMHLSEIGRYKNVLVVAPHMDDETIGAGGTIIEHVKEGAIVNCVIITDGSSSQSNLDKERLSLIRKQEMSKVKDIIGISKLFYLDLPDGQVTSNSDSQQKLIEVIQQTKPDLIYCTPYVDAHPDHIHTTELLADCIKTMNLQCTIRLYEINCPIPPEEINCVINISENYHTKNEAINAFSSQAIAFDGFIELSKIKKQLVISKPKLAVETFLELNSNEFVKEQEKIPVKEYDYYHLFKQVNRSVTLLWAIYQNIKLKKNLYKQRIS